MYEKYLIFKINLIKKLLHLSLRFFAPTNNLTIYLSQQLDKPISLYQTIHYKKYINRQRRAKISHYNSKLAA